jgi:anti-sigma regulatory factor (Ser/Thr protein kinase)
MAMCHQFIAHYPSGVDVPAHARTAVAAMIDQHFDRSRELADDVALVLSELVTNSVQAGARHIRVQVTAHRAEVEVAVRDDAPGWPAVSSTSPLPTGGRSGPDPPVDIEAVSSGGRGLRIVSILASRWDIRRSDDGPAKTVEAHLPVPADAALRFACRF